MRIFKCETVARCEVGGCRNRAVYAVDDGVHLRRRLCLCEDCLKAIYREAARIFTPKAPDNFVGKAQKNARYSRGAEMDFSGRRRY